MAPRTTALRALLAALLTATAAPAGAIVIDTFEVEAFSVTALGMGAFFAEDPQVGLAPAEVVTGTRHVSVQVEPGAADSAQARLTPGAGDSGAELEYFQRDHPLNHFPFFGFRYGDATSSGLIDLLADGANAFEVSVLADPAHEWFLSIHPSLGGAGVGILPAVMQTGGGTFHFAFTDVVDLTAVEAADLGSLLFNFTFEAVGPILTVLDIRTVHDPSLPVLPEPALFPLVAAGLVALAWTRRNRRRGQGPSPSGACESSQSRSQRVSSVP